MSPPSESIIIVGAGIVGSALAHFLSSSPTKRNITIIDRSIDTLVGSTGHAPGFVGQFNESEVLTRLAIDTVGEYKQIPGGFDTVGGLEVAFGDAGVHKLMKRAQKALELDLPAVLLSLQQAAELAPGLVKQTGSGKALYFLTDGTANAGRITSSFQENARGRGVEFVESDVRRLLISDGRVSGIEVFDAGSLKQLNADKVILATGIWAQELCKDIIPPIPVVPVGHPYIHGKKRTQSSQQIPFVRWPETHVYARDHGDCYGLGTYNHEPLHNRPTNGTAIGDWAVGFDDPLKEAIGLLPEAAKEEFKDGKSFNGIFSMTPDNMPLAGSVESVGGLYLSVAVWVTHAAGTAKFIAKLLDGADVDEDTWAALDPGRFRGQQLKILEEESLRGYNEIYKTVEATG